MRSTIALEAKEKGMQRNNVIGPKFEDTSKYFLDAEYYDSRGRSEILCSWLD